MEEASIIDSQQTKAVSESLISPPPPALALEGKADQQQEDVVEQLRRELEKERQSKMALENMIIASSLSMIEKIEVLEKKHEAQIDMLRYVLLFIFYLNQTQ